MVFSASTTDNVLEEMDSVVIEDTSVLSFPTSISYGAWNQRIDFTNWLENPTEHIGRVLVLIAAAIYGTNFSLVKMLDEAMPLAYSAALRFSIAAFVVTTFVLLNERPNDTPQDKERQQGAVLAGMEVGIWYCMGYLAQAYGLMSTDASKVSCTSEIIPRFLLISYLD